MRKHEEKSVGITTPPSGTWVQTERAAHERWAKLTMSNPRAASVLHTLVAQMGRHNAVIISLPNLARLAGCSRNTLIRAISTLRDQNWIQVMRMGASGTTNVYIINDRVGWTGSRDAIRYSLFSATVFLSEDEQVGGELSNSQTTPLERIPVMYPGEKQLPAGPGLPPPSDPEIPGLEIDIPSKKA